MEKMININSYITEKLRIGKSIQIKQLQTIEEFCEVYNCTIDRRSSNIEMLDRAEIIISDELYNKFISNIKSTKCRAQLIKDFKEKYYDEYHLNLAFEQPRSGRNKDKKIILITEMTKRYTELALVRIDIAQNEPMIIQRRKTLYSEDPNVDTETIVVEALENILNI